MGRVEEYRKRRDARLQSRCDADDDDGRWVTTQNGHKIHINEEGVPDKGNPHVLAVMNGGGGVDSKVRGSSRYRGDDPIKKEVKEDVRRFTKARGIKIESFKILSDPDKKGKAEVEVEYWATVRSLAGVDPKTRKKEYWTRPEKRRIKIGGVKVENIE